jgi:hypothetical protein
MTIELQASPVFTSTINVLAIVLVTLINWPIRSCVSSQCQACRTFIRCSEACRGGNREPIQHILSMKAHNYSFLIHWPSPDAIHTIILIMNRSRSARQHSVLGAAADQWPQCGAPYTASWLGRVDWAEMRTDFLGVECVISAELPGYRQEWVMGWITQFVWGKHSPEIVPISNYNATHHLRTSLGCWRW